MDYTKILHFIDFLGKSSKKVSPVVQSTSYILCLFFIFLQPGKMKEIFQLEEGNTPNFFQ